MTGYLHIPTKGLVEKLTEWFENELTYEQFTKWADKDFAANLSALLRDLSVEPTEAGICGEMGPPFWVGPRIGPCALRAGHDGWHEGEAVGGTPPRWTHTAPTDRDELLLAAAHYLEAWAGGDNLASAELRRLAAPVPVQEDRP